MEIILSGAPSLIMGAHCKKKQPAKWIYLGKDRNVLKKLNKIFSGEENVDISGESLYTVSQKLRTDFVEWIDSISLAGSGEKEWLFSVPAVKNTTTSNLFLYVCYFFLFKKIYFDEKTYIDWIIVDSPALGSMLRKEFPKDIYYPNINYLTKSLLVVRTVCICMRRFVDFFINSAKQYLSARIVFRARFHKVSRNNNIVLIRQYILRDYDGASKEYFWSHYFPGLENYLIKRQYKPIFLAVTTQVKQYTKLYRKILKTGDRIVVAEEFFQLIDYFQAFFAPIRACSHKIHTPLLEGYSFERVLREEFYSNVTDSGMMMASLYSRLGQRLVDKGISPTGIINWNENQAFEKGLIHGLRLAVPKIEVIGSQPFIAPPNLLSIYPSKQDRLLSVTADRILVLGPIPKNSVSQYDEKIRIYFTPAFRYSIKEISQLLDERRDLLVLIGNDFDNAIQVVNLVIGAKCKLPPAKRILVKLHPGSPFPLDRLIREVGQNIPDNFEFVDGRLDQYVKGVNWGICGATGASLDLVSCGIPVAIVGNNQSLTMNYLAYREDQDLWRLCFTENELVDAGNHFHKVATSRPELLIKKGEEFKEAFFAPDAKEHWTNYLIGQS